MTERRHKIAITIEGKEIAGWIDYEIQSSMIVAADAFSMSRPWDREAWDLCALDSKIRVSIDGVTILDGLIDRRCKRTADGVIEISGRDKVGRLVDESAPSIAYDGLEMTEAIRRLASPWFGKVVLSDARNRAVRRGKGRRVPAGTEPVVIQKRAASRGRVHPGESRWKVIEEIVSQAGLICWSSADGRELVVGRPNYAQAPQFLIVHTKPGSSSRATCKDLQREEDNGDRYSMIVVVGAGGITANDYGDATCHRRGIVVDNEGTVDGTGRDFKYPKRLIMPERSYESNEEASRVAAREQARRDYRRITVTATMDHHGQYLTTGAPTLFAPNTIARVIDEELEESEDHYLITECTYRGSRTDGEITTLSLVPTDTEILL